MCYLAAPLPTIVTGPSTGSASAPKLLCRPRSRVTHRTANVTEPMEHSEGHALQGPILHRLNRCKRPAQSPPVSSRPTVPRTGQICAGCCHNRISSNGSGADCRSVRSWSGRPPPTQFASYLRLATLFFYGARRTQRRWRRGFASGAALHPRSVPEGTSRTSALFWPRGVDPSPGRSRQRRQCRGATGARPWSRAAPLTSGERFPI